MEDGVVSGILAIKVIKKIGEGHLLKFLSLNPKALGQKHRQVPSLSILEKENVFEQDAICGKISLSDPSVFEECLSFAIELFCQEYESRYKAEENFGIKTDVELLVNFFTSQLNRKTLELAIDKIESCSYSKFRKLERSEEVQRLVYESMENDFFVGKWLRRNDDVSIEEIILKFKNRVLEGGAGKSGWKKFMNLTSREKSRILWLFECDLEGDEPTNKMSRFLRFGHFYRREEDQESDDEFELPIRFFLNATEEFENEEYPTDEKTVHDRALEVLCQKDPRVIKNSEIIKVQDMLRDSLYVLEELATENLKQLNWGRLLNLSKKWHEEGIYRQRGEKVDWDSPVLKIEDAQFLATALCSTEEMNNEGKELCHCIASFSRKCADGLYTAFSVRKKSSCAVEDRFSIGFKLTRDGWVFDQAFGERNRELKEDEKTFCTFAKRKFEENLTSDFLC